MAKIAREYVRLVLAMGQHDKDYVDAYYGPEDIKSEAEGAKLTLDAIGAGVKALEAELAAIPSVGRAVRGRRAGAPAASVPREAVRRRWPPGCGCSRGNGCPSTRSRRRSTTRSRRRIPSRTSRQCSIASRSAFPEPARSSIGTTPGGARSSFRARSSTRCSQAAIGACRERTRRARHAAGGRALHRRVRHQQIVERLQLVSGQLQQPDPGQHRPADLHRSRDRPRLPRRLSGPPRLQRAARAAPGEGARLDRVHRLSALLAAIADRRGHGELRDRGRVPGAGARSRTSRRSCFRSPASTPRARRSTTR